MGTDGIMFRGLLRLETRTCPRRGAVAIGSLTAIARQCFQDGEQCTTVAEKGQTTMASDALPSWTANSRGRIV